MNKCSFVNLIILHIQNLSTVFFCVMGLAVFAQSEGEYDEPCGSAWETWETVCSQYQVFSTYPMLQEGFENGFPEDWISFDQDRDGNGWSVIQYDAIEGSYSAYSSAFNFDEGNYVSQTNWLVLQPIEVPEDGAILSWWDWDFDGGGTAYGVYVSHSLSETFQRIYAETPSSYWNYRSVNLDDYAGQTIYIAFIHYNAGYYLFLDDINVEGKENIASYTETGDHQYLYPSDGCVDTVTLHLTVTGNRPMVVTYDVDNISASSADGWGSVVNDCGDTILESGLCYSTHSNPTVSDSRVVNEGESEYFSLRMTGLEENTTYYMRAYATNTAGTSYGEEREFTTFSRAGVSGTVTDAATSRPIAGAYVSVMLTNDYNRRFVTAVTTDASGHFELPDLMNSEFSFVANAAGYESAEEERTLEPGMNNGVNFSLTPEDCQAPVNVDYELAGSGSSQSLRLSWDMPGDTMSQLQSMSYSGGSYGLGSQYSVGVYHLFTPEQLAAYNGGIINSVGAYITGKYEYTTYTLRIWVGGTEDDGPASGTPAYEQVVGQEGIVLNAWNDIPLNTPFTFDGTQCLWIGFHVDCYDPAGNWIYAIGLGDYNNVNNHYGNVLHWYREGIGWLWYANSGYYYNWMIRATLVPNTMTYNVLSNGTTIASGIEGTNYTVSPYNSQQEQTCFQVTANCPNGQTSEPSECAMVKQSLPSVETIEVSHITDRRATVTGAVTDDGNSEITERGFCWSNMAHPTLTSNDYYAGYVSVEEGEFMSIIEYLYPQQIYHIRAYATNSVGTAYGNELVFVTKTECFQPYDLTVSDVVSSSAYVTWQGDSNELFLSYELSYKAEGSDNWTTVTTTDKYYMLTGLQQQTTYMVRVRSLCDEFGSDYVDKTFTTGCMSGTPDAVIGETEGYDYANQIPVFYYYPNSYSQQIYDASEVGVARSIDRLYLQYYYSTASTWNVDIYLGHTNKSDFSNSEWIPYSDLTLVYSGDITFSNEGDNYWFDIPLTTAFDYNGTDNLVLAVDNNTNTWTMYAGFYTHNTQGNKTRYAYTNNADIDPAAVSGWQYNIPYRNNIRIPGICNDYGCDRANVVVRSVTESSATLSIVPVGSSGYELQYALDGVGGCNGYGISAGRPAPEHPLCGADPLHLQRE